MKHTIGWRTLSLATVSVVAAWLALGCAPAPTAEGESVAMATGAEAGGKAAPEFELVSVDGEAVRLSDMDGRVRLIDFWATWCAPCREEIPMLNELQATYGPQGFRIVAISDSSENAEVVREFLARHDVSYTNLLGTDEVAENYVVLGLPTAFLVDADGRIVETFVGAKPRKALEREIRALLGGASAT